MSWRKSGWQFIEQDEVWSNSHIAQPSTLDFTRWLQGNLDVLNDAVDITLSGAEREESAGAFFLA